MTRRDAAIARAVCRWFKGNARKLPWRECDSAGRRNPYLSLVSEVMLQQTQVSRVLDRFGPFIARFPTVQTLAAASDRSVLAAWSGMGYYRRARNLHAAAREIVARFDGRVPDQTDQLLSLPGIGRYTAGAIASIVFGRAEPIVDGNVARVLMRVEGKELSAPRIWERAERLVEMSVNSAGPGAFNEGLMELGALICTPRGPRCGECPLGTMCTARARGTVDRLPRPKERGRRPKLHCASVVLRDSRGRFLVEQRPAKGMWAGLWQAPTLESTRRITRATLEQWLGVTGLTRLDRFAHGTTHREVEFEVWWGDPDGFPNGRNRCWRSPAQLGRLGLSNAQRRVLAATR